MRIENWELAINRHTVSNTKGVDLGSMFSTNNDKEILNAVIKLNLEPCIQKGAYGDIIKSFYKYLNNIGFSNLDDCIIEVPKPLKTKIYKRNNKNDYIVYYNNNTVMYIIEKLNNNYRQIILYDNGMITVIPKSRYKKEEITLYDNPKQVLKVSKRMFIDFETGNLIR